MSTESPRARLKLGAVLLLLLLGYLSLPVHRVLPVCNSRDPEQPRWQAVAGMSPTFRRLFANGLRNWELPFVEFDGVLLTWPHVIFTARFGDARFNVANKLTLLLAQQPRAEEVLSGEMFGVRARLPPELWQRLWDEPGMDQCDQLRIAVHLEPNEP